MVSINVSEGPLVNHIRDKNLLYSENPVVTVTNFGLTSIDKIVNPNDQLQHSTRRENKIITRF